MVTTVSKPSPTKKATPAATKAAPAAKKTAVAKNPAATKKAAVRPATVSAPASVVKAVKPNARTTALKPSTAPHAAISAEQRAHYVSVAAFYIAERRGFTLGNPEQDWLQAEAEIDRLIASGHFTL